MKRTIKIGFEGFWKVFDPENNFITDALRKTYDVMVVDKPDYLFYSVFNDKFVKYDCVRIFFSGENITPDFNLCDYGMGYDHIAFGDRYIRYPLWLLYDAYFTKDSEGRTSIDRLQLPKTAFCSFVYSNPKADPVRRRFFEELCAYKMVDAGGKLYNNIGKRVEDKRLFEGSHKFAIAFENVSQEGYTTEKLIEAFAAGCVPVYWGDSAVSRVFNPEAFIDCSGYTVGEMVDRVKAVDRDDGLYERMRQAPVFCRPDYIDRKRRELEEFLGHIIEQPYEKAFRNTKLYWKARYQKRLCRGLWINRCIEAIRH